MQIDTAIALVIGMPLLLAGLSYLLGRYAIRAILYALWAAIVIFGIILVNNAAQTTGEFAGQGQYAILLFGVGPGLLISVLAGVLGILRAKRARAS